MAKDIDEQKIEQENENKEHDPKLVETIEAKLEAVYGDEVVDEIEDSTEETEESEETTPEETEEKPAEETKEEVAEETEEEKPAEDTEETEESTSKSDDGEGEKEAEESTLPDAYVRAAIHQGWTEDEVKEFYKADPEKADKTFAKIYTSTNKLSQQFAQLGRAKPEEKPEEPKPEPKVEFKGVDLASIKKDMDADDPMLGVLQQMQDQSKALHDELEEMKARPEVKVDEAVSEAATEADKARMTQIDNFFVGLDSYVDFYGTPDKVTKDWKPLSEGQQVNRVNVLRMADQMIVGAQLQGQEMSVDDALELAHLSISEPVRERTIREKIKKDVVKRSKSITLKPKGGTPSETIDDKSPKALEARVAARLKKVYNS